jgi:serine/threonine protein phosphatase 1
MALTNNRVVTGRIYAIGDVHGCCDQITALLTHLEQVEKITSEDQIIFLGDYIDRGPNSKGVLDRLIKFKEDFPSTVFLRGNHEDMFMGFLGMGGNYGQWYLTNGGNEVFKEYNLSHHVRDSREVGGRIISGLTCEELRSLFPANHIAFIQFTERHLTVNDTLFFVHAGLNPKFKFENQTDEEFFWVREPFLMNSHTFEKTIIHGHTISPAPYFNLPYEISLDTGCFFNPALGWDECGALSCLKITDSKDLLSSTFLQVKSGTTEVIASVNGVDIHDPKNGWKLKK